MAFIKQEAVEKAREIQIKADEEFAIEKAKIVRQEAINIDSQYDKKIKQAEVAQKIAQSNQTNKSRLKILQTREQHLQSLFDAARDKLNDIAKDQEKYKKLVGQLILQVRLAYLGANTALTMQDSTHTDHLPFLDHVLAFDRACCN